MACTFTQVLASLASKVKDSTAFLVDSSIILKSLRTLIYRHSLSLPARVRAPQTKTPLPVNVRLALIDLPATLSTLRLSNSLAVNTVAGALTPFTVTLAGAFQTPRLPST